MIEPHTSLSLFFQSQKDTVANIRTRSQQKAQQLRQKARQTLFNKRRNQTQQPQQSQKQQLEMDKQQRTPTNSSTGVKQRLGVTAVRGRGRGMGIRGRGRGRGGSQAQSAVDTSRPGSQLKNIRYWYRCTYSIIITVQISIYFMQEYQSSSKGAW